MIKTYVMYIKFDIFMLLFVKFRCHYNAVARENRYAAVCKSQ